MKLLGYNLKRISAERMSPITAELKVGMNVDIVDIKEAKQDFIKSDESLIAVDFAFGITYEEKVAKIVFDGTLLLSTEKTKANTLLKEWKNKNVDDDFRLLISNIVMKKSAVKAMQLEEDLNLPFHIQPPVIRKKEE